MVYKMTIKYDNTLGDIVEYFQAQGFFYDTETIYNFYISLITKPFLILSGISGSGKSKIAEMFASYMAQSFKSDNNYEMVAVKPNWMDNRGIFGYHNLINETYQITPTLKLFLRALANPDKPHFLVLDEMNLAKVEYYFSDFLSLLESRRATTENIGVSYENMTERKLKLSEVAILSALQLNTDRFETLETYRNTPIVQWWFSNYSQSDNQTAQFRTEFNQGRPNELDNQGYRKDGSRLAGRMFLARAEGNSYKLKKPEEMNENDKLEFYSILNNFIKSNITQKKIELHTSPIPLKTYSEQKEYNDDTLYSAERGFYVPSEIEIPLNVFVIGTVNVDETTYMFSPKVLDRSNVLEFNKVNISGAYGYETLQPKETSANSLEESRPEFDSSWNISLNTKIQPVVSLATSKHTKELVNQFPKAFEIIKDVYEISEKFNKHFGYRVFNEISLYILNYIKASVPTSEGNLVLKALDNQILQKILPKISGSENEVSSYLQNLQEYLKAYPELTKSIAKIILMSKKLEINGYVTFIE